jgi:EmrB/QacA subfamily drug resistance transporter
VKTIPYKWIALIVTTIGVLMSAIDSTIVILGLPSIMTGLHSDIVTMVWVVMGYILMSTVFLLTFGRIADILGRVRMYNLGFVVFTIGSVLCGLSQTALQLVIFRLIQGAGGAMLMVNSLAIITEAFPQQERGRAMGWNAVTWGVGGVAGPVLGGLILSVASWRWLFYINLPVGIAGTIAAYLFLQELAPRGRRERFDLLGAATFSLGLVALLLALTEGIYLGWLSAPILGLFALSVGSFVTFIYRERRISFPVLDLRLFRNRVYSFSVLAAMFQSLAVFAVNFLMTFYLQGIQGYGPLQAAFLLVPLPLVNSLIAPLGGRLTDRIGGKIPASLGLLIQAGALVWLALLRPHTPYPFVAGGLAVMGVGSGLFWSPNTSTTMSAAPRDRLGVASGTLTTLRNTGMVSSFAVALAVAASTMPRQAVNSLFLGTATNITSTQAQAFTSGMSHAFLVSLIICLVAAAFSVVREGRKRAPIVPALEDQRAPGLVP